MARMPELSTPWVAGSNPAGIAHGTAEKSPINKGFSDISGIDPYTPCVERKGINGDKSGPKRPRSPGKIPGMVSLCETGARLASQPSLRALRALALLGGWAAIVIALRQGGLLP